MQRIIVGGSGFLGQALTRRWRQENIPVTIVGRSKGKIERIFGNEVTVLAWDEFIQNAPTHLHQCSLLLNLAGENIASKRWSETRKQEIIDSRVNTTKQLAKACAMLGDKSPPLFNASAIGIYGLQKSLARCLPKALDESTTPNQPAPDFLSEVGQSWEAATNLAKAHGVRVVLLRFGIILGQGGALEKMNLPFKLGLGGPIGSGQQPFSWVHIDDVVRAIEFLFERQHIVGSINIVAPECITQKELAKSLGRALHRPAIIPIPSFVTRLIFGQMGDEMLLRGQHVVPKYLENIGFDFSYPDIDNALREIYS